MDQPTRRSVLGALASGLTASTAGCAYSAGESGPSTQATIEVETPDVDTEYTSLIEETVGSVALVQAPEVGSQGSAFVYDEEHLVTNHHVVEGTRNVDLRYTDNDWTEGLVVGSDRRSDLAVIRTDSRPSYATPLPMADSPPVVGEPAIAVGNPFGFSDSVSAGIVSGTQRSIPFEDVSLPNAVQTDASLNPGNSGGPLLRTNASVMAVVSLGAGAGVGFGISAPLVQRVVPELIETGSFAHPFMGVALQDVTPLVAEENDLSDVQGAMVVETVPNGPADGTLQEATEITEAFELPIPVGGDVILAVDDEPVAVTDDLSRYLALETAPEDTIEIEFLRDGEIREASLTLAPRNAFE